MIDRFLKAASRGLSVLPWESAGGQYGGPQEWLDAFTFRRSPDQRPAWQNSAVGACIGWAQAVCTEPPLVIKRHVEGDPDGEIIKHPIRDIVVHGNPDIEFGAHLGAFFLSDMVDGNTYYYKERSASGKVIGLRYIPHFQITPQWPADGSAYISHYLYTVDTAQIQIPKQDIIHIRNGIDPERLRHGLSPVRQILREVLTDNEAAVYSHAILRNMGIIGAVMSPKDSTVDVPEENHNRIRSKWRETFTGDGRGGLMIAGSAIELKEFGATPEKLVLDKVRKIPTDRICAAYRIPPAVVGLSDKDPTYSNLEGYTRIAWQASLLPALRRFSCSVWKSLATDITGGTAPGNDIYMEFETSAVGALQRDINDEADRLNTLFGGGIITRGEARRGAGYSATPTDEVYMTDLAAGTAADQAKADVLRQIKERSKRNREANELVQSLLAES